MSQRFLNKHGADERWNSEVERMTAAAKANPAWKGKEDELALQIEASAIVPIIGNMVTEAKNRDVDEGKILHAIGVAMGSVLVMVTSNFDGDAFETVVNSASRIVELATIGTDETKGQLVGSIRIDAVEGGRA